MVRILLVFFSLLRMAAVLSVVLFLLLSSIVFDALHRHRLSCEAEFYCVQIYTCVVLLRLYSQYPVLYPRKTGIPFCAYGFAAWSLCLYLYLGLLYLYRLTRFCSFLSVFVLRYRVLTKTVSLHHPCQARQNRSSRQELYVPRRSLLSDLPAGCMTLALFYRL